MDPVLIVKLTFVLFSIIIAVMDYKTGAVPRLAFIGAFALLFTLKLLADKNNFPWFSLTGVVMGLAVFLLAFFLSGKKLGLADVWYSGIIGFVLGPWFWYLAIAIACVSGIIYILLSRKKKIPFIPLMAVGGIVAGIVEGKLQ